jgi:putative Ca2+/H+ antiporter (TMEM165/GDT1 family)
VKTWKILWLIHSGITVELFTLLIVKTLVAGAFTPSVLPAVVYLCIKVYSWIAMASLFRHEREEKRKENFRSQWITNTIIATPNIRLTLPRPDVI